VPCVPPILLDWLPRSDHLHRQVRLVRVHLRGRALLLCVPYGRVPHAAHCSYARAATTAAADAAAHVQLLADDGRVHRGRQGHADAGGLRRGMQGHTAADTATNASAACADAAAGANASAEADTSACAADARARQQVHGRLDKAACGPVRSVGRLLHRHWWEHLVALQGLTD